MKKELPGWIWMVIATATTICLGFIDWFTGYAFSFFVFYFIPVAISAWFVGRGASLLVSILCAIVWFGADNLSGHVQLTHFLAVWNTLVRLTAFIAIAWSISQARYLLNREHKSAEEMRQLLSEVKVLEAFLPICCQCKKIRNDEGKWQQMESYIGEHAGTKFSHGYCPECFEKLMIESGLIKK
jgi:hypothetical protein